MPVYVKKTEGEMNAKLNLTRTAIGTLALLCAVPAMAKDAPKMYRHSSFIEKERPELNDETKRLIAAYRQNPTEENRAALRRQVEINYDNVIARKQTKLAELKQTARHESKIREMEQIVDEVIIDKENRIEQSMRRFTDPRLRPGARESKDGFLPVLGAAQNVEIAYTPVTNAEYAAFLTAKGRQPSGDRVEKANHPATNVSYDNATAYARWLSAKDGTATYRLPTEREWELAAGHMPKDADFNNGEHDGTTPVTAYKSTLSASGAVDMWGNCWEWTSTVKNGANAVKGGSYKSARTDCRTEERGEIRTPETEYGDVCFRLIREK